MLSDCTQCKGLCCIGPEFREGEEGIPGVKKASERCTHLTDDFRCRVQKTLKPGYTKCTRFDCGGIGPILCKQNPSMSAEELAFLLIVINSGNMINRELGIS